MGYLSAPDTQRDTAEVERGMRYLSRRKLKVSLSYRFFMSSLGLTSRKLRWEKIREDFSDTHSFEVMRNLYQSNGQLFAIN